tara:strand:+ start:157 stop:435 length:279 start_codon:yes stop_codon:yes gene_type:complete
MTMTVATRACIVRENIAKGYGVEDIALMYRMPVDAVRAEVAELREIGAFKHLFSGSKPLQTPVKYGRNKQGRKVVEHPTASNHKPEHRRFRA